jgi:hypothetical protein
VVLAHLGASALAVLSLSAPVPASSPVADVTVTQRHLVPVCLDGAPVAAGQRRWRLDAREHVLAVSMKNRPRSGVASSDPGVAVIRFSPEPGHRYEVEVRAPALSYSSRVWERGQWTPVVRDRTVDRIVSSAPEWTEAGCRP